jgi:hypothetical protein
VGRACYHYRLKSVCYLDGKTGDGDCLQHSCLGSLTEAKEDPDDVKVEENGSEGG